MKKADDWKVYTVHDASMAATIATDLSQDAVPEALQELNDWENESPQSKLTGEYLLRRPRSTPTSKTTGAPSTRSDAFRKSVTMGAQLADAMNVEIENLQKINDKTRAKEVAEDFLKRFPGHPFEAEIKEMVAP
jgi:hypothetical protein